MPYYWQAIYRTIYFKTCLDETISKIFQPQHVSIAVSAANMVAHATEDTDENTVAKTTENTAAKAPGHTAIITGAAGSVVEARGLWVTSPAAIFRAGANSTR